MKTAHFRQVTVVTGLVIVVVAATAGCVPRTPAETVTATPTVAPSSATPTPTPTLTPTPTPTPFAITCDSIVSPAARSGITAPPVAPADFFAKNASGSTTNEFSVMRDNGGTVCAFGKLEIVQVYGYSRLKPGEDATIGGLITSGDPYTTSSYLGGTLYTSGMDGNPFTLYLVTSKEVYLATTMPLLNDLLSTVPPL